MADTKKTLGLTGKFKLTPNFWGSLVLYVQEVCVYVDGFDMSSSPEFKTWRKAEYSDLQDLDLR